MKNKRSKIYLFILVVVALLCGLGLGWQWSKTVDTQEKFFSEFLLHYNPKTDLATILYQRQKKPTKREVKGLYLTAYSAGSSQKLESIIDLINRTELNAVVIDIKDYSGKILYDSDLDLVNELKTEDDRLGDVEALIDKLHDNNIYVIARQTVFQDPILARLKSEWAIKSKYGGLWRDKKGLAWVDPTQQAVWEYNLDIAREAITFGFDEINFDYVRFPTDGNMSAVVYTNADKELYDVMHDFFHFLNTELSSEPAWVSLDFFGFVMERHDGISIGQRLEDSVNEVDYISPMMYPSHYPPGHLGLDNPAAYPALVIENGMKKGMPYFEGTRAKVRPWIQAFNIGATYGAENIRAQIDMVEKYSDGGWLLWNAANRYTTAGLLEK